MAEWQPITDLEIEPATLTNGEMRWLGEAWQNYQGWLQKNGRLEKFQTEFNREWAIEAGNVERVYDLERGVIETLISQGIVASHIPRLGNQLSPERIALIIEDALEVVEGLFAFVKSERRPSKSYVHELHQTLTRHQDTHEVVDSLGRLVDRPLEKGVHKKHPNNPRRPDGVVHQYCPPEHVESEMDRLLEVAELQERNKWPVEVRAAWLHHRFTQIHPYADGNGRIARALASLVLIKQGHFPLLVTKEEWTEAYIPALERADGGDLASLVRYVVEKQRKALIRASAPISTAGAASENEPSSLDSAIELVHQKLVAKGELDPAVWMNARQTVQQLRLIVDGRLEQLATRLAASRKATLNSRAGGRELQLTTPTDQWRLFATIEVPGSYRGLFEARTHLIKGSVSWRPNIDDFLVTFAEPIESAKARFEPWLHECLRQAILEWSKTSYRLGRAAVSYRFECSLHACRMRADFSTSPRPGRHHTNED